MYSPHGMMWFAKVVAILSSIIMEKWDLVLFFKKFLWFFAGVVVAGGLNYINFCWYVVRRLRLPRRDFESTMRSPTVARTNGILSVNEPRIDSR